jgi:hypothetical protein
MMFYTYAHYRKDDGRLFYIGKGKGKRAYQTSARRSTFWNRVVNKHGRTVEILASWEDEVSAFAHEKFLIKTFREMGFELVNKTDGGEGMSGAIFSAETREKIGSALRGKKLTDDHKQKLSIAKIGVKRSREVCEKISTALSLRIVSDATKEKIRESNLGQKRSEQTKVNLSDAKRGVLNPKKKKPVRCINTGEVFAGVKDAAMRMGCSNSNISGNCRGRTIHVCGLKFEYVV